MKPSTLNKALAANLESKIFVTVYSLGGDDLEIDAGYNRQELVSTGETRIVGVYELVALEEVTGVETVTFKEIK